jgi:hypothetical protein
MRVMAVALLLLLAGSTPAAEVESIVWRHYLPQDYLETVVRSEKWLPLPLDVPGGVRKGDIVRIWAGGSVDWGNCDQPGQNASGPAGPDGTPALDARQLALTSDLGNAFAVLIKCDRGVKKCFPAGKALAVPISRDKEALSIGFNDLRGHYHDNHLGRGRRNEIDPLWLRVEVVRIIVD